MQLHIIGNVTVGRAQTGVKSANAEDDRFIHTLHRWPMPLGRHMQIHGLTPRPRIGFFDKFRRQMTWRLPNMSVTVNDHGISLFVLAESSIISSSMISNPNPGPSGRNTWPDSKRIGRFLG